MEKDEKSKKRQEIILAVVATSMLVTMFVGIFIAWSVATMNVSGSVKCTVDEVDYVTLTDVNGSGECMFPLVKGNTSICALPKKFECSGIVSDVSMVRAIQALQG